MKQLLLSALIIGSFCAPVNAGPAQKLANRLGISVKQARQMLAAPKGAVTYGGSASASGGGSTTDISTGNNLPVAPGGGAVGAVSPLNLRY